MTKKILIVDDEKFIRETLGSYLGRKGYEVYDAENCEDAIKIVKEKVPHIVLLDIRMPDHDGVEVLKRIKEVNKDIGVIMVTGVTDTAIAEKCMELGAFDYITKPISLEYLEECLSAKFLDFYK
ncbi:MAG: response regulator [Candidatus Omnitrophica bacterium]|nr:response regulator [Candidatus Omnitrophota bacterium]